MKNQLLNLTVDNESIHIYRDKGEMNDPIHIKYWHQDEWQNNTSVMAEISESIALFHTDQKQLLEANKLSHLILTPDSLEIKARKAFQSEVGMQLDELYLTSDGEAFVRAWEATNHQQANRDKCNAAIYLFQRHETLVDGTFMVGDIVCLWNETDSDMVILALHGKTAYCSYATSNGDAIMEVAVDRLEHYLP